MSVLLRRMMGIWAFGLLTLVGQTDALGQDRVVGSAASANTALNQATAFLNAYDASFTKKTHNGAAKYVFNDDCYLGDGYTKPVLIALFEADPNTGVAADKYRKGAKSTNIEVLADRKSTNPNGSHRRELDLKYQINYADGTVRPDARATLISGSSAGSVMVPGVPATTCTTPQTGGHWRFFGNRRIVDVQIRTLNERAENHFLQTGALREVTYTTAVQLRIVDASDFAKYVVITGPALPPSGVKMLSVRLLRSDPLLAGKTGNYVDFLDTDAFRFCRETGSAATVPNIAADKADCVKFGGSRVTLGGIGLADAALADATFDALGFVAGGTYQVAVYNDEGWKTINGHAGMTPKAVYTQSLLALPYSAVTLAGTGVDDDLFPRFTSMSMTDAQIAEAYRTKAAFTIDFSFTALAAMPDGSAFGWGDVASYEEGNASAGPNFWPLSRQYWPTYPDTGATAVDDFVSPAPGSLLLTPTYGSLGIELTNRNGRRVWSYINFF